MEQQLIKCRVGEMMPPDFVSLNDTHRSSVFTNLLVIPKGDRGMYDNVNIQWYLKNVDNIQLSRKEVEELDFSSYQELKNNLK